MEWNQQKQRNSLIITFFFCFGIIELDSKTEKINLCTICWLLGWYDFSCMFFFSILTYFLWCLLMMPSIFSIQLFVSARKSRKGKIRNQQKIRNYYIFSVSESWDWIPKPKINDRWVCMIYSFYYQFLHILLWCLLMMPSIFQFEKSPPTASKRVMPS